MSSRLTGIRPGESVAVNGVCLTALSGEGLAFDAVPETLSKTTLGSLRKGNRVNLEPALRAGEPLGGHFVQGHIDGTGEVREVARRRGVVLRVDVDPSLTRFMIPKGSIAIDGVSLTLVDVEADTFSVALVPFTLRHTTLGKLRRGDRVNVETDLLAKYAQRRKDGVTKDLLRRAGFLG